MRLDSSADRPVPRVSIMLVWLAALLASFQGRCASAQGQTLQSVGGSSNTVPYQVRNVTVEQKLGDSIPLNLPLTDSSGRQVKTGYFIDGNKPTIITLNYSNCPMLCSVQLNELAMSLSQMDLKINEDFQLLSVSIDPKETTQQVHATKEKYVTQLLKSQPGARDGWAFCTAKQPIITRLANSLGFKYKYDRRTGEYYHPAMLAFVSPEGVITRYSLGVDFPPDQMKKALVESGDGTVGSAVDQFVLWCFSYDAESNSYVPQAWKIMRLAGAATVGLVLACLTPYWIGRKRMPASPTPDETPETA
ncbi:MAG: SCO family protein [Pirellulales bacterium]|nr:SCO family protein [Pirellulales bacterium]